MLPSGWQSCGISNAVVVSSSVALCIFSSVRPLPFSAGWLACAHQATAAAARSRLLPLQCEVCWHLPCARQAAQTDGSVVFNADVREVACSKHAARRVVGRECESRWLQHS